MSCKKVACIILVILIFVGKFTIFENDDTPFILAAIITALYAIEVDSENLN